MAEVSGFWNVPVTVKVATTMVAPRTAANAAILAVAGSRNRWPATKRSVGTPEWYLSVSLGTISSSVEGRQVDRTGLVRDQVGAVEAERGDVLGHHVAARAPDDGEPAGQRTGRQRDHLRGVGDHHPTVDPVGAGGIRHECHRADRGRGAVSYTNLRADETGRKVVCRLL